MKLLAVLAVLWLAWLLFVGYADVRCRTGHAPPWPITSCE